MRLDVHGELPSARGSGEASLGARRAGRFTLVSAVVAAYGM